MSIIGAFLLSEKWNEGKKNKVYLAIPDEGFLIS